MSDTVELGSLPIWDERNLENTYRNIAKVTAVMAIVSMRYDIHDFPAPEMTDAQHRMIRRILGDILGHPPNGLAIEIIGTITGDNGRDSVRGASKHAASVIIGEMIDGKTKSVTNWGRTAITGITYLVEEYPEFDERSAYIQRVEADMRSLRRSNHRRSRYARSDNHTWKRARELISRNSNIR